MTLHTNRRVVVVLIVTIIVTIMVTVLERTPTRKLGTEAYAVRVGERIALQCQVGQLRIPVFLRQQGRETPNGIPTQIQDFQGTTGGSTTRPVAERRNGVNPIFSQVERG